MTARTYRSARFTATALAVAVALPVVLVGTAAAGADGAAAGDLAAPLAVGIVGAGLALRAARMRLRVDDRGVTVVAFLRTTTVPWPDVVGAVATADGLGVLRAEGRPVVLHALGRSPRAGRRPHPSPADEVAAAITAEARARQEPGRPA